MHVCITLLVNLLVEFENGEKRSVDLKKVEPEGDDLGVFSHDKGGRVYSDGD